jgi:sarcosine oxidase
MQSSEPYDVAVIGAGAMGAATAWQLARRAEREGRAPRVLVLERFAPGHDRGSSHGPSRIIRLTYEHADYVRLAVEAYAAWEELERDAGEALFFRTADLFFGPRDGPIEGYPRAMAAAGVELEAVDAGALARRFPQFRLGPRDAAFSHARSGILASDRCVAAMLRCAARRGVVAAGPWVARVLPDLALPVRVVRQEVVYLLPADADAFRIDRFPVWVSVGGGAQDDVFYGLPIFGDVFGAKVARHRRGGAGDDPDATQGEVGPAAIEDVRAFCAERIPACAAAPLARAHGCAYTVTPDEDFILDAHPGDARVVVASPCSGHGFKFASAIGRIAAELAVDGRSTSQAFAAARARFGLRRLVGGGPVGGATPRGRTS